MASDTPSSGQSIAVVPLTVFDRLFERTTFVTGWLVEGMIDGDALGSALRRVTDKWRLLAGRIYSVQDGENTLWRLKVPLGQLPKNYPTFALNISVSDVPLSRHITIPIQSVSTSLPLSVFMNSATPRQYTAWEAANHPLTCWSVVYFPADANNGVAYTAIGFARCHGVFDGIGASMIVNALISELKGEEWEAPPMPQPGLNTNPFDVAVKECVAADQASGNMNHGHVAYTHIGPADFMKMVAWHTREKWWRGADRRILLVPKLFVQGITEEVRKELSNGRSESESHVTSGDVLVAWIFKTTYSTCTNTKMNIHCTNIANIRPLLSSKVDLSTYVHNAFVPLPYPVLSVEAVQQLPLSALTNMFAAARASLSSLEVSSAYQLLQKPCFPNPPNAGETLNVSNVSASRILEADWTVIGSKRTMCGYRYQATPTDTLFTNAVYIAGRLADGTVVLDVSLNKARLDVLAGEVQRYVARIARMQKYAAPPPTKKLSGKK
ncbi:hypothetical protein CVT24_007957 [Panaeolus cyanescens]|uniref:O-acyltransferase WSD1 C-terminal domain-containing protein n=1 Tax=Panaeolus cyanescens TaxID=181874 RepID=A0A409W4X8_9AGAR|nr:hypothetical protein CVT24_007957 [Panaeolus cyanescens]